VSFVSVGMHIHAYRHTYIHTHINDAWIGYIYHVHTCMRLHIGTQLRRTPTRTRDLPLMSSWCVGYNQTVRTCLQACTITCANDLVLLYRSNCRHVAMHVLIFHLRFVYRDKTTRRTRQTCKRRLLGYQTRNTKRDRDLDGPGKRVIVIAIMTTIFGIIT
jgi:hypothetical protein